MRVGLLFGTYNPVHLSHLLVAERLQRHSQLNEVWLVLSPRSPFKQGENLVSDAQRFEMLQLAVKGHQGLIASDAELAMPQPNYTVQTLEMLVARYPKHEFVLLMGEDNLAGFSQWREPERILELARLMVYPRPESGLDANSPWLRHPRVVRVEDLQMTRSSSSVRQAVGAGGEALEDLPPDVAAYIREHGLYR
ncbi:MAG: nicotinate (nicotinamide) nucleotide adenylyltransferase [Cryomorphaceae bacterium]|nr:nicotinate (nicotinamide) nucleotide adenylyltransferase [Cryomorphaceae bacterium]